MVVAGVGAILALVVGIALGRSFISESEPPRPDVVRFDDALTDVSLSYPASWTRLRSPDIEVRLLASSKDASTSLIVRVTKSGIDTVTRRSLPVVQGVTDQLLKADGRTTNLSPPTAVELGGLLGYRYRYSYSAKDGGTGAHVHYFLFKAGRLIQLVFQVTPANGLAAIESTFDRIAGTFRGVGP